MRGLFKSFSHATRGIIYAFKEERNFQIEVIVAILVLFLMVLYPLTAIERSLLLVMIAFVLTMELLNTCFERMLDMLKPHVHPYVKVIKDLVAGAVLLASAFAFIVGLLIFLPFLV